MNTWSKFPIILGVTGCMLASACAGPAPPSGAAAALQAIQQAPDPSAVVAAYANGVAADRTDSNLNAAYVARMVDLGLPELAYHQAESLTTVQSNNGLAWGVIAHVHARRGEMGEAISAINLAGQFAPGNLFIQHTAGEIVAWYDTKGDQANLPENARNGLAQIRSAMEHQTAFASAYDTAKNAYQTQGKAASQAPGPAEPTAQTQPPADQLAPMGYATAAPPPPAYYPAYYYDWGPTWVEPAPWWWWQPVGFFAGFEFFPFSTVIVFDHDDFFHHHQDSFAHDRFAHDRASFHNRSFHHDGMNVTFHESNRAFFHRDGKTSFFGTTPRATTSVTQFHTTPRLGTTTSIRGTTPSPVLAPPRMTTTMPNRTVTVTPRLAPTGRSAAPVFRGSMPRQNFAPNRGAVGGGGSSGGGHNNR